MSSESRLDKQKDALGKMCSVIVSAPKKRWESKQDNFNELIYSHVLSLSLWKDFIAKYDDIELPFDVEFLMDVVSSQYSRNIEKMEVNGRMGMLASALVMFGCSRNQALESLAEWGKLSKSTVRTANENYKKYVVNANIDTVTEALCLYKCLEDFLSQLKSRNFPRSEKHKKAKVAIDRISLFIADRDINGLDTYLTMKPYKYLYIRDKLILLNKKLVKDGKFLDL